MSVELSEIPTEQASEATSSPLLDPSPDVVAEKPEGVSPSVAAVTSTLRRRKGEAVEGGELDDAAVRQCDRCGTEGPRSPVHLADGSQAYYCKACAESVVVPVAIPEDDFDEFTSRLHDPVGAGVSTELYTPSPLAWACAGCFVHHTRLVLIVTCLLPIIMTGISAAFSFEIDASGDGFLIRDHELAERRDGWEAALDVSYWNPNDAKGDVTSEPERTAAKFTVAVYFEMADESNILEVPRLQRIREVVDGVADIPGYRDFCHLVDDKCAEPLWLGRWLYPNASEGLQKDPSESLATIYASDPATVGQLVDRNFQEYYYESTVTRVFFSFGAPLPGFATSEDPDDEQEKLFTDWAVDNLVPYLDDASTDDMSVVFVGSGVTMALIDEVIVADASFAGGAVVFVALLMLWHTNSVFLTVAASYHILMSFPATYFVFRVIFDLKQVPMLAVLSLYLLESVGSDDAFLFTDAFKQSALQGPDISQSLRHRIAWAWQRASHAVTITSFTTSAAFLINAVSIVPPVRVFGLFSGVLILINYLMVISWYPAILVVWSRHFEHGTLKKRFAAALRRRASKSDGGDATPPAATSSTPESGTTANDGSKTVGRGVSKTHRARRAKANADAATKPQMNNEGTLRRMASALDGGQPGGATIDISQYRRAERFFYIDFSNFLQRFRWPILAFMFAVSVAGFALATQISPADEPAKFFSDEYPLQRVNYLDENVFAVSNDAVQVRLHWGIDLIDRSSINEEDITDVGQQTWDMDWREKFGGPADIAYLQEVCDMLRTDYKHTARQEVGCFADDMEVWYNASRYGGSSWPPETRERFLTAVVDFAVEFDTNEVGSSQYRRLLRFDADGELLAVTLYVNSTIPRDARANSVGRVYFDETEAFAQSVVARARDADLPHMARAFQTADGIWVSMQMDKVLQDTAILGMGLSLVLAAVVLLISTANWWVTLLAMISLASVVASFVALFVLADFQLEIVSSITFAVLVGLASDYSIHVAIGYHSSLEPTRFGKVRSALVELGVSVASAFVTTACASSLLLFAEITFFSKFGVFMVMIASLSAFFAFFGLTTLLLVAGPEGDQGEIQWMKKLKKR
eukprot:CAMPEP_0170751948 /NCGR_PEP_ID=MMETSP0437-20130122/11717_1 /TAXON_ID=0 /ORGANISM="Sexangularia sp." /LENGTH=1094 /DNA_ID=CAMNT_0011091005 /DNA_START=13 /DNA_END=3297 /DNA_ORIENTATION=+